MYFLLEKVDFRCHVSLSEGIIFFHGDFGLFKSAKMKEYDGGDEWLMWIRVALSSNALQNDPTLPLDNLGIYCWWKKSCTSW